MAVSCNHDDAILISFQHHSSLAASCLLLGHEPLLRIKSKPERLPRHCHFFFCIVQHFSAAVKEKKGFPTKILIWKLQKTFLIIAPQSYILKVTTSNFWLIPHSICWHMHCKKFRKTCSWPLLIARSVSTISTNGPSNALFYCATKANIYNTQSTVFRK